MKHQARFWKVAVGLGLLAILLLGVGAASAQVPAMPRATHFQAADMPSFTFGMLVLVLLLFIGLVPGLYLIYEGLHVRIGARAALAVNVIAGLAYAVGGVVLVLTAPTPISGILLLIIPPFAFALGFVLAARSLPDRWTLSLAGSVTIVSIVVGVIVLVSLESVRQQQVAPPVALQPTTPPATVQPSETPLPDDADASPTPLASLTLRPTRTRVPSPMPPTPYPELPPNRLVIPVLGVDSEVVQAPVVGDTWSVEQLIMEIGHLEYTGFPGAPGNMGLAGHITLSRGGFGPFRDLAKLDRGDLVVVYTDTHQYTYIIDRVTTVKIDNTEVLEWRSVPTITLITCQNWNPQLGHYTDRTIVQGHILHERTVVLEASESDTEES